MSVFFFFLETFFVLDYSFFDGIVFGLGWSVGKGEFCIWLDGWCHWVNWFRLLEYDFLNNEDFKSVFISVLAWLDQTPNIELILNIASCFTLPWPKSESHFILLEVELTLSGERITIFRTQDPYVSRDRRKSQFITSRELTLETYDKIGSKALCELGLGEPGEIFWVRCVVFACEKIHSTTYVLVPTCFRTPYTKTGNILSIAG